MPESHVANYIVDISSGIYSITPVALRLVVSKARSTQLALTFQLYTQLLICYFKKSFLPCFQEYPAPIYCTASKNHDV